MRRAARLGERKIAFLCAREYIGPANPDLPRRFALRAPPNEPRSAEFYAGGANGYTDYPSLPPGDQSPDLNSSQARVNARVSSGL
jgi:hypothetical protein